MKTDTTREVELSTSLRAIMVELEKKIAEITGASRTPAMLLIKFRGNVQYIANVHRGSGTEMLTELLDRWKAQLPDIPEHKKKFRS